MAEKPERKVAEPLMTVIMPCRGCKGTGKQELPAGQMRAGGGLPDCPHCYGKGGHERRHGMDMIAEFLKGPLGID